MKLFLSSAILGSCIASASFGATMTFTPTADGIVQTFGGDSVSTADDFVRAQQSGGLAQNGILEFDLAGIDDAATINSASLSITLTAPISNTGLTSNIDVFAYNGDGTVDIDDFDASGTQVVDETLTTLRIDEFDLGNGLIIPIRVNTTGRGDVLTFDFSDIVPISSALLGDLLTLRVETDSFASVTFGSLESLTYDAAALTIDYTDAVVVDPDPDPEPVPLPAGAPLLLAGLGAFALIRRRQRS